jgi:predicted nucleotidyltransferase
VYLSETDKQTIIEICKRNDISYCAVFGSFARGEATENSDIDLLVKFSKPKGWDWIDGALEIEEKLGRKVDWATKDALSKYIVDGVMQDLQVIYEEREFAAA